MHVLYMFSFTFAFTISYNLENHHKTKHPSIAFSHTSSLIPTSSQRVHSNSLLRPILLALLSDPRNVALASDVPQRNVLLHARRQTAFFGGREGRAGGGDALVEAVFVDFLFVFITTLVIALAYSCLGT